MPQQQPYNGTPQFMPIVGGNGNSSALNWVNMRDLHPTNELAAVISGGSGGALAGALAGVLFSPKKNPVSESFGDKYNLATIALTTGICALAGGVGHYLHAHTHNQWAEKTQDQLMEQQRLEAQARSGTWTDRSQQLPASQGLGM